MKPRPLHISLPLAAAACLICPSAQAAGTTAAPALTQATADILWMVIAGLLVFFMQAGFALLESGLTRAKNAVNIFAKNFMDFSMGALAFWAVGHALMYGEAGNGLIGWDRGMIFMQTISTGLNPLASASWFFQMVFAATAATIISGAVAERMKLSGYLIASAVMTGLIYPVVGHWFWAGDGWLSAMGVRDFAGSTVVHSVGGWAALVAAFMLGPRKGKYSKDGSPRAIPGHSLPMAAMGTFILWFGWFGFNAGSTLSATSGIAHVVVTTALSGAAGMLSVLFISWIRHGKPDLSMALNGCLGGLVGITAGCASVSTGIAVLIGVAAGSLVYAAALFVEKRLRVDDPVGAVAVHGVGGAWGTLAVGLFGSHAIDTRYAGAENAIRDGLLLGGGWGQLGIQALAVVVVLATLLAASALLFGGLRLTMGLRVSEEEEYMGLDLGEHGMAAYHGDMTGRQLPDPEPEPAPSWVRVQSRDRA